jgi:D-glycero-D-manno-heptose 1,7-bisphosphate phosphatase
MTDSLRAVFLDRDDTLIVDENYMSDAGRVRLIPGAREALLRLHEAGYTLVVISNQSGVARGLVTPAQVLQIEERVRALLLPTPIAAFEYCFHHPDDGCDCRKPKPTLVLRVAARLGIDLARSAMVGDKESDVLAGRSAGCWSLLVRSGPSGAAHSAADFVVDDLGAAAELIVGLGPRTAVGGTP